MPRRPRPNRFPARPAPRRDSRLPKNPRCAKRLHAILRTLSAFPASTPNPAILGRTAPPPIDRPDARPTQPAPAAAEPIEERVDIAAGGGGTRLRCFAPRARRQALGGSAGASDPLTVNRVRCSGTAARAGVAVRGRALGRGFEPAGGRSRRSRIPSETRLDNPTTRGVAYDGSRLRRAEERPRQRRGFAAAPGAFEHPAGIFAPPRCAALGANHQNADVAATFPIPDSPDNAHHTRPGGACRVTPTWFFNARQPERRPIMCSPLLSKRSGLRQHPRYVEVFGAFAARSNINGKCGPTDAHKPMPQQN